MLSRTVLQASWASCGVISTSQLSEQFWIDTWCCQLERDKEVLAFLGESPGISTIWRAGVVLDDCADLTRLGSLVCEDVKRLIQDVIFLTTVVLLNFERVWLLLHVGIDINQSYDFHPTVLPSWLALITEYYYELAVIISSICSKTILPSTTLLPSTINNNCKRWHYILQLQWLAIYDYYHLKMYWLLIV